MKLVNLSVKRPVGVIMVVAAILALGFVSLRSLTIDLYPEIDLPIAVVSTSYEGAAPQEVEKLVSRPVESSVSSIEGLEVLQSQSQAGASLVLLQFNTGVNLDSTLLQVRENVDQIRDLLPEGASDPSVLRFDPQQLPIMTVGLSGDTPEELQQVAEDRLVPFLERQEGVASVSVEGGQSKEVQVLVDRAQMATYGLDSQTVMQSLNASNQSASAGKIEKGQKDLQIRIDGEFGSIEDVRNTIIQSPSGAQVTLEQIADVEEKLTNSNTVSKVDGSSAVVLSILKKTDANTVETSNNVRDAMDELEEDLPEGIGTSIVLDTSEFIKISINSVVLNIILGGIFSVVVLLLFLKSIRATLVIGLSIPIAIISTFTLMYFTGETLNVLTMGGLALGIGMMVDSSIVILENIVSYRQRGYSMVEAAKEGASELAPAVVASATTTLVVFLPIIFVEGIASELFTPLALTIMFALIASLAVSVTLIPMLSSKLLTKSLKEEGRRYWFNRFLEKVNDIYRSILRWVLKFRKTTMAITIALIAGSFALIPLIGTEFIPPSDQGQVEVRVNMPEGTSLDETENLTGQIDSRLEEFEEWMDVSYLSIGGGSMGSVGNGSSDFASYTIQLIEPGEREKTTQTVMKEIDEALSDIPGAEIEVSELDAGLGTGAPLQVQINGTEYEVLDELAGQVAYLMNEIDGVENAASSTDEGRPEMQIEVNQDKAAQYGLTDQQVIGQVQLGFNGQIGTRYRDGSDEIDVRFILPEDERQTIADLEGMPIQTPNGALIPLATIAELNQVQGPVSLLRQNQQPQVNVEAEISDVDLGTATEEVRAELERLNFPDGYSYSIGGQAQDMQEAFGDLSLALIFSIFLVYAVMAIQFENFLFPFIIMFSLPATIIGISGGLFVTGLPFSLPAFVGIIMLAGIVVNNAIVLVDYINILRRKSYDRYEAILEAGPNRLRPILMTTLTTVLGMVPLALGIGRGAEAQQPLAVTIIFGLTVSSFFTLVLIPVVYTYLDDLSNKITSFFRRRADKT
ncbi:hydrophobic/amphiphilic exporter-1, HAE1 family [Halobacillus dabanensis]|uniref:Hydrophobic/amphiphilic exporter-1, HAE1 family n=1 Tax=Halobacillus dabanensis TaxID=240302 RepID=A0A1I3X8P3_HALDA|nr:efflux RND transporter permease subunit [Halobacillus dabanensis]SFK15993.1 hydrophobic/amphiphilic exporter-1, HAE1 family [Halobacillus dabanensis]